MSNGQSSNQVAASTLLVVWSLLYSALAFSALPPVVGDIDLENNKNAVLGFPQRSSEEDILVSRRQYLIDWSIARRGPRWVSWTLNKRGLGDVGRTNVFRVDHDLNQYLSDHDVSSVTPEEYKGSCIDRGHQVASSDRTSNVTDNQATFIMTNISPQSAFMNRRPWASFEKFLRTAVLEQGKEVYILSGTAGDLLGHVGKYSNIQIHASNFKIAVIKAAGNKPFSFDEMRLLAVEVPNLTSKGTNPVTDRVQACYDSERLMRISDTNRQAYWRPYVTTLARVEQSSGLDLSHLANVPEMTEDEIADLLGGQMARSFESVSVLDVIRKTMASLE